MRARVWAATGAAVVLAAGAAAAGTTGGGHPARTSAHVWAPAASATIHPGIQTYTAGAQCTANFVFTDATGATYLGQAAHCAGTGSSTQTDGCTSPSLPLGTAVQGADGKRIGTLAYSSWLTMQQVTHEKDSNTCAYNDLALIKVDASRVGEVNPSVPFFGGPSGLATAGTQFGDTVLSYGNSSLRLGISLLSPKQGYSLGDTGGGWSHQVYTVTPGIPGDSGSGFLTADGKALGVLSTVAIAPFPGENGVGDLAKELAYANAHGTSNVSLADGDLPFQGGIF